MSENAQESPQVVRARKKIAQKLLEDNKRTTPEAIMESSKLIREWIQRHDQERIHLKNKNIALFDQNKASAATKSKYVLHLMQQLQKSSYIKKNVKKSLGGRIKKG